MFDDISPRYDFLNHLLSFGIDKGWRRKVRKLLAKDKPQTILDVATGTADLAIELSKIGDVRITGVDISRGMLEIGERKVLKKDLTSKIRLLQSDGENLPFKDNEFDAVTVSFGVRNFDNLEKGISEMQRVLKENGKLAVLEFSKPGNKLVGVLYWFYFKNFLPLIGRLFSRNAKAYRYLPASVSKFPEGEEFASIVRNCGFKSVAIFPLTFGVSTLYICEK